jgi:hypothetical protein
MPRRASDRLLEAPFLLSLATLLANDFILKASHPGLVTGKLSDVAGLFAFAVFCCALFPRYTLAVHLASAVAFIYWKSPYAQSLIESWNRYLPFHTGRTVDSSDLLALPILALSYSYLTRGAPPRPFRIGRRWKPAVAMLSAFAFVATSYRTSFHYATHFRLPMPTDSLFSYLRPLGIEYSQQVLDTVSLQIPAALCFGQLEASVQLRDESGGAHLQVLELTHHCPSDGTDSSEMLRVFEHCFLSRLDSILRARAMASGTAHAPVSPEPVGRSREGCEPPRR